MKLDLRADHCLPQDGCAGTLVGRAWVPGAIPGPSVVALRAEGVFDLGAAVPTMTDLLNADDPLALVRNTKGTRIGATAEVIVNSSADRRAEDQPYFLAPCDLQPAKACGVTFVTSMLERVIEEQAKGDSKAAEAIRRSIGAEMGAKLRVKPGSPEAMRLKEALVARGAWSPYLEVGIGPDAEVFTKAPAMASVGLGAEIGLHPISTWNNPEPEVVLAAGAAGRCVGATLGNDVNLRDVEGRSALLLGKAKDNNASSAIGPFLRLFDETFSIDDLRQAYVSLRVEGEDQFVLEGGSSIAEISRDLLDLLGQTVNRNHQYPDGVFLYTGTMFAPVKDRGEKGRGFTHKLGDIVTVSSPKLGALVNRVTYSDRAPPWTIGTRALMQNLRLRGRI
jgi:fumarylacetoacetate (FAA) hydrolase family protein